jgi:hypothetical protein
MQIKGLFPLGKIAATAGVLAMVPNPKYLAACLAQHIQGKWGLIGAESAAANDAALRDGTRLLSSYPLPNDPGEFWVTTEGDRSLTTCLLPSEY